MNNQQKKARTISKRCRAIIREIDELRKELAALKCQAEGIEQVCWRAEKVFRI
jgi:prefoldin subunit 5